MTTECNHVQEALSHYRNRAFADWLTVTIGLAAQTNPEELRAAFAQVFDLSEYEKWAKKTNSTVVAISAEVAKKLSDLRHKVQEMESERVRMMEDMQLLRFEIEELNRKVYSNTRRVG